jgi:uncharacterized protein YkwD
VRQAIHDVLTPFPERAPSRRLAKAMAVAILLLTFPRAAPVLAADPGDLPALRAQALAAVNADRKEHGLEALRLDEPLNEAAQAHAEDMLARNYFAHESPEGDDVQDRYRQHGGKAGRLVAENIARCTGCAAPVGPDRIDALEEGWMNSPEHRANILTRGLDHFGYGIAVGGDRQLYAVQTFSGAGMPIGLGPKEEPRRLSDAQAAQAALREVNAARQERGLAALEPSDTLDAVARALLPRPGQPFEMATQDLAQAVPEDARDQWARLAASSVGCGGCGATVTDADLRWFGEQWLASPDDSQALLNGETTHLGFAATADGEGRKLAVLVLGRHR